MIWRVFEHQERRKDHPVLVVLREHVRERQLAVREPVDQRHELELVPVRAVHAEAHDVVEADDGGQRACERDRRVSRGNQRPPQADLRCDAGAAALVTPRPRRARTPTMPTAIIDRTDTSTPQRTLAGR